MAVRKARARSRAVAERPAGPYQARRLLLDTHTWLWWQAASPRLGPAARRSIATAPEVWLSAASVWEMSIKAQLGKLKLPRNVDIVVELVASGFRPLAIDVSHAMAAGALARHHRDPFDRMLIAQAQIEGLTIVTSDEAIARYGARTLDATE